MYRTVMLKYKIIRMTHNKRIVKCVVHTSQDMDDFYTAVNIYLGVFIRLQESLKQTLEHYILKRINKNIRLKHEKDGPRTNR